MLCFSPSGRLNPMPEFAVPRQQPSRITGRSGIVTFISQAARFLEDILGRSSARVSDRLGVLSFHRS